MKTAHSDPRARENAHSPLSSRSPREGGIALFIVLVLVLVLTIVIFQLTFTTGVEERIANNRKGFLELSYTLQAVSRSALQQLETDLMEDLGLVEDESEEDLDDTGNPAGNGGNGGPGGNGGNGQGGPAAGDDPERFDLRHEEWAHQINETLNEVSALIRIFDGEGQIDVNHLFEYPQYPEEESDTEPPESADENPTEPEDPELEEEWIPPTSEQVEDAQLIISRLVQALIASNEDAGFIYQETPDPDAAADDIVSWVNGRIEEPSTRLIRSIRPLLRLESVSHELFYGPKPEEEENEEDEDLFEQMTEDLGEMPGFEQFEEGVEEVPRPLGLRDVLTAHSTGKLNLNTARPEVYVALMLSFEDFDEAQEIAALIDEHLNSYKVEDEEGGTPAGTPAGEEEEDTEEFNQFSTFADLGNVDETWGEGDATDDTILELLKRDLEPIAVFKSTFFTVHVDGELGNRKMRGMMAAARMENDIMVLSWEEFDH